MEAPVRDSLSGDLIPQSWVTWFKTVDNFIRSGSSSGTTANRPTKNLFVGLSYLNRDLGKSEQVVSLNPTVWATYPDEYVPPAPTPTSVTLPAPDSVQGLRPVPATAFTALVPVMVGDCTQVKVYFSSQFSGADAPAGFKYGAAYMTNQTTAVGSTPSGYLSSTLVVLTGETVASGIHYHTIDWSDIPTGLGETEIFPCIYAVSGDGFAASCFVRSIAFIFR